MSFSQSQQNGEKRRESFEENFFEHLTKVFLKKSFLENFLYNIFKKFNETANTNKKGRDWAIGSRKITLLIIDKFAIYYVTFVFVSQKYLILTHT